VRARQVLACLMMTHARTGLKRRYMDPRVRELVLLALLCALLCGVALMYEQQLVAAVFAALACGTVVLAVALRRLD
jgi:hypothetical protein